MSRRRSLASQPGDPVINIRQVGITVELGIRGEVDMASVATLREQLSRALANKPEILIVDLRAVTFIDSSGLHALLSARSRAVATGTALVVIRPTGPRRPRLHAYWARHHLSRCRGSDASAGSGADAYGYGLAAVSTLCAAPPADAEPPMKIAVAALSVGNDPRLLELAS
jgi:anti-anti-sigma factor